MNLPVRLIGSKSIIIRIRKEEVNPEDYFLAAVCADAY